MEWGAANFANKDVIGSAEFRNSTWQEVVANAERFNEPGRFTAIVGYEWTSMPNGDNLHRVVVFADGADKAGRTVPFSSIDSSDPEKLKKDAKYRRFLEACHWDVTVIDECQHVAERSVQGGEASMRARLARLLAQTCDSLILTSATPHDGRPESFASSRRGWSPARRFAMIRG